MSSSDAKTPSSNAGLHYVENFTNPYVKIILVCKICNKEMSLKFSSNWKKHYLTHASNDEKPHKCTLCSKAFITITALRKHVATKHSDVKQDRSSDVCTNIKQEQQEFVYF
ncbi:zinc finger protein GFI1 homolog pag-3-like [Hydractinia symbiolongicarpus]|uniref:zinc finger protein GFI1 homolog pag-3-like n=1 Tax=Hydractinia symbiolongicarpus TaxID=13093 RepID=UPI0025502918|nr:zinc finger protein GFI1 homolog pag-3-like [Hydractinia symbiolongicarpus]